MKVFLHILGILVACVGIYFGITMVKTSEDTVLPDKYVYVSSSSSAYNYSWAMNMGAQYLGGDAYNYIVEASLKAGYYNAMVAKKTIYDVGGKALIFLSAFFLLFSSYSLQNCLNSSKQVELLTTIAHHQESKAPEPVIAKKEEAPEDEGSKTI